MKPGYLFVLCLTFFPLFALDGQLSYYRFEKSREDVGSLGLALESAGSVYFSPSRFGRAVTFSGNANSYLFLDDYPTLGEGDFSISLWLSPKPQNGEAHVFDTRGLGQSGQTEGVLLAVSNAGNGWRVSSALIDDGEGHVYNAASNTELAFYQWHHVALVYSQYEQSLKLFIDGAEVSDVLVEALQMDQSAHLSVAAATHQNGQPLAAAQNHYRGYLDELRVFDWPLWGNVALEVLANQPEQPERREHTVDFMMEYAGASHQLGWFFLDMDTNQDGIPNFLQVGDSDDLDGDLIPNKDDDDDDGDGIKDWDDHGGYFQAVGPSAGFAPPMDQSTPPSFFAFGEVAAMSGMHLYDYWQFVPNGTYEQTGQPYQFNGQEIASFYLNPAAYLYVDVQNAAATGDSDEIPDLLQNFHGSAYRLPAFGLDKGYETRGMSGEPVPGLLGTWAGHLLGETVFKLCDDDFGSGTTSHFGQYNPYPVADTVSNRDFNPDYLIYGSESMGSGQIPWSLNQLDDRGVERWRYRKLGQTLSTGREIVYFLNVYWYSGGQPLHTYYSKAAFNPSYGNPAAFQPNLAGTGRNYGLDEGMDYLSTALPIGWFPRFLHQGDHDRLAEAVFGAGTYWEDIASFPGDGSPSVAVDFDLQSWVDRWSNLSAGREIINYLRYSDILDNIQVEMGDLPHDRYGIDLLLEETDIPVRREAYRLSHCLSYQPAHAEQPGVILSWEDLNGGGDRDFNDVVFFTNMPPNDTVFPDEP